MRTTDLSSDTNIPTRGEGRLMLLAIALAYVSLGTILGFVQGGVAPIMRAQGMPLSALRWVYALYLPFGLAFLWAPMVDARRWPWLGRRTGWIVPMQGVCVVAIVVMAFIRPEAGSWGGLLALGFVATVAAATMDVALDALTVETMPPSLRAAAAGAKMGGISLGAVIGGGVLVAWYPQLAWHGTLLVIALATALSCLPVFTLVRRDRQSSACMPPAPASLIRTLRKPDMPRRFLRLTLLVCTLLALFSFNRLLLVDMGVSLERIGSLLGVIAPLANAAACFLAPALIRAIPVRRAAWFTTGICVTSACVVWSGYVQANVTMVIAGSIVTTAGAAGLYVVLGGLMLEWASGHQAATDYALLYGTGRFIGTAALMILPGLIQQVGWSAFLGLIILAFTLCAGNFLRLFRKGDALVRAGL